MSEPALLSVTNVSKTFSGQLALKDVHLDVHAGEVHALVGQNGCGKSTLLKILTGYHRADPGARALVRGRPHSLHELLTVVPLRAVHQDLGLILELNAIDNIGFGTGFQRSRHGGIAWRAQLRRTVSLLEQLGVNDIDPRRPLSAATQVERTMVAIARAVSTWDARRGVLILDEPTSSLPDREAGELARLIRDLAKTGVGIIYVSHALSEVTGLADRATVLREGTVVDTVPVASSSEHDLVELMLGKEKLAHLEQLEVQDNSYAHRSAAGPRSEPMLAASNIVGKELRGISFQVSGGEIVGFAGLAGSGHLELAYALGGARRVVEGAITVGDRSLDLTAGRPITSITAGIALVPPDRTREGLISTLSVAANMSLPSIMQLRGRLFVRRRQERERASQWMTDLEIVPHKPEAKIATLSGGNRQKVLFAKWVTMATHALVLAEPTVGVDVGARLQIYDFIRQYATSGVAVVICSTDITDLLAVCDRVYALYAGHVVREIPRDELSEHVVLAAISGLATPATAIGDSPSEEQT
jgi:ribose transport system ATP-binding protein